jgi:hypothetical protein
MRAVNLTLIFALASVSMAFAQEAAPPAAATPAAAAPKAAANLSFAAGKGHIKVTPETEALWKELGQAQTDLHQKEWEIFTLMSAAEVDKQAVRAKQAEARDLMKQMRGLREKLAPSWVPVEKKPAAPKARGGKARPEKGGAEKPAPAAPAPGA